MINPSLFSIILMGFLTAHFLPMLGRVFPYCKFAVQYVVSVRIRQALPCVIFRQFHIFQKETTSEKVESGQSVTLHLLDKANLPCQIGLHPAPDSILVVCIVWFVPDVICLA